MKAKPVFMLLALLLALAACSPQPTPGPTPGPSFTPRPTFTITPPPTATATSTATITATPPPPPTPTIPPAAAGTPIPAQRERIIEATLPNLRELARWGNGRVQNLAWSPDGAMLAVATPLGLYLYDAATLQQRAFLQTNAPADHPVFSPDSTQVAAAVTIPGRLGAAAVLVWSAAQFIPIQTLAAPGQVLALAYAHEEGQLLALSRLERGQQRGATLTVWDASGNPIRSLELIGGETAETAAFAPDFRLAVTRGPNGPVRLWQLSDGANFATTQETGNRAGPMAFSPDGQTLAVGYMDTTRDFRNQNEIRVWRVPAPGEARPATLLYALSDSIRPRGDPLTEGMEQTLLSLAWSPDGERIAAGYEDRTLRVWRAAPSQPERRMTAATLPFALAWSPDGERIAAGGLEIFQAADAKLLISTNDFLPGLNDLALSPSGNFVALAGYNQIEIRRVEDGSHAYAITGMDGAVNAVDISTDGTLLVAACDDGTTRLYRLSDGRYLDSLGAAGQPVLAAAFSADGRWIASGNESMMVQIFRVNDGQVMMRLEEPYVSYRLLFSPNVDQLASLTTSGVWLRFFDAEIQEIETELEGMAGGVGLNDIAYSPGEEYLAMAGNGLVRVIDPLTREDLYVVSARSSGLPEDTQPWSVAFSPDNAFLAVGWSDGVIRIYWAGDGSFLAARPAHPDAVLRLRFTSDGRLLLSLGAEGTIRLWGIANP